MLSSATGCTRDRTISDTRGHGTAVAGSAAGHSNDIVPFEDTSGDAAGYDYGLGVSAFSSKVTIDGTGVNGTGLVLQGGTILKNLKITHFGGVQIKTLGTDNLLSCVVAKK